VADKLFSQIAIAIKGGELREPGLANLAERLAQRSGQTVKPTYRLQRLVSGA
jgi:hypothetical protein